MRKYMYFSCQGLSDCHRAVVTEATIYVPTVLVLFKFSVQLLFAGPTARVFPCNFIQARLSVCIKGLHSFIVESSSITVSADDSEFF